jgi:hypothetical protein
VLDHGPPGFNDAWAVIDGQDAVLDVRVSVIVAVFPLFDAVTVYVPAGLLPSHAVVASHVTFPLPSAVFVYVPLFGPV